MVTKTKALPVFGAQALRESGSSTKGDALQIHRWEKSGRLIRLKRGLYALPEDRRTARFSLAWLANSLYSPSYLSLEYVLSQYDMIPERVLTVTSITRLKTAQFTNPLGHFSYRNIKEALFFGFESRIDENGVQVLIATPEKAVLDMIYLIPNMTVTEEYFRDSLRWQQLDQLNLKRLAQYAKKYKSKKIDASLPLLMRMAKP